MQTPTERKLELIFVHLLVLRFWFPFVYGPMEHLFSDPARHWYNGVRFFSDPQFMNGVDAKFYQLLLWLVAQAMVVLPQAPSVFNGLLCALTPLVWYKAARELLPRDKSLMFGLIVAVHPSLLTIFSYTMTETIALPMLGLGLWLTLRAVRKRELKAFLLSALVWVLCFHTRTALIPLGIICLLYGISHLKLKQRNQAIGGALLLLVLLTLPAALYSYRVLYQFVPFMYGGPNQVYYYAATRGYELEIKDEALYGWISPSMDSRPLRPFSELHTHREQSQPLMHRFTFYKMDGAAPWQKEITKLRENYSWRERWLDIRDNALFFVFGHSWPDSSRIYVGENRPVWEWNYSLRWTWPPVILLLLALYPWRRLEERASVVVGLGFAITLLMIFQNAGVMEGRYRKPFEPLFVLGLILLLQPQRGQLFWQQALSVFKRLFPVFLRYGRAAAHASRGKSAPDTRPAAPGTRTANLRRKTAAKPSTEHPSGRKTPRLRKSTPPEA